MPSGAPGTPEAWGLGLQVRQGEAPCRQAFTERAQRQAVSAHTGKRRGASLGPHVQGGLAVAVLLKHLPVLSTRPRTTILQQAPSAVLSPSQPLSLSSQASEGRP